MNTKTAEEILNERIKYYIGTASTDKGMRSIIVECMEKYAFQLKDKLKETRMYAPEYLHESIDMLITKNDFVVSAEEYASPLKKRIEELEACGSDILKFKASLIRIVEMKFDDPSECSAAFERLSQLINPYTNGK